MATKKSTRRAAPTRAARELNHTAIHEAGHAVLQTALGLGCERVTIVSEKDSAGHARHGGEYGKQAQGPDEADDDVANLRLFAEDAFLLRHAIADYAGAEAVRRAIPRRKDWKAGAESDYRQAAFRIGDITTDVKSIDLLFKYAQRRCQVLVEHYLPEIKAVAPELLEAQTLTGERVREIIRRSIDKRSAGLLGW